MSRPLIGLTTYREPATWRRWQGVDAALLPAAYVDAIGAGGATALLIPPLGPADSAADVVARLDGLLVSGGADVNPARYGEHPHPRTGAASDARDVSELALLAAAQDIELPVLGVCRGMQVMAVAAGGRLAQHVPDLVGHDRHCPGEDSYGAIDVRIDAGSALGAILGSDHVATCHHHQSVAEHPGYRAVAAAADGLLEAFELPGDRFAIGVQWHPEAGNDRALFEALADAAGAYAASRRAAALVR
jgi:putative glutamine amidotransferase